MTVIDLSEATAETIHLVGGKAAGLGAMLRAGERVPAGFCLTTEAHRSGTVPRAELAAAYEELGGGPVAVRSSSSAEDLPEASFAGQQETFLGVAGVDALVEAVRACWESLDTERAVAYRQARGYTGARMAVVVQRMIDPAVAGVLFSAHPVTGRRDHTVVDAAPGLGTAVVDGTVDPDRYVLEGTAPEQPGGSLTAAQLAELHEAGQRLESLFGAPQDAEWALDHDGTLWLLQSRAITTLFPQPSSGADGRARAFLEAGSKQGMLRPFTPLGSSVVREALSRLFNTVGARIDPVRGPQFLVDLAGRFYIDLSPFLRDRKLRERLPGALAAHGHRGSQVAEYLLRDPGFAPGQERALPHRVLLRALARYGPGTVSGTVAALVSPGRARRHAYAALSSARAAAVPPAHLADPGARGVAAARLTETREVLGRVAQAAFPLSLPPVWAALLARSLPRALLRGVVAQEEIDTVLRGAPDNITTDMDLRLWSLTAAAREHHDLLANVPPEDLAERYRAGELPEFGLTGFLEEYGHRAAAEVDVGVPRWREDPAPVLASLANYLRVSAPEQAPDHRFAEAAQEAERTLAEVRARARRARPLRGAVAGVLLDRARRLAGLREFPKFAELFALAGVRDQVLAVGAELAEHDRLDDAGDVVLLTLAELDAAVTDGTDLRGTVDERRRVHDREIRRAHVPTVVLSDGTDVEAVLPRPALADGDLGGVPAAPGSVTGRARVVLDPARARVEPGEVLVAPATDPGWTPLFLTASGLVTETGSSVAHGPTVAREYGIPAVVGVQDATRQITTGQRVTVDGSAGTVVPHEEEHAEQQAPATGSAR